MNILTTFRAIINDSTSPYTLPDIRAFEYLDLAIDKLSQIAPVIEEKTITITQANIDAGFITTTDKIVSIISFNLCDYQQIDVNKIKLSEDTQPGDYKIKYRRMYKKYDGVTRTESYFDYPSRAGMGIVFYALGVYQDEKGVIDVQGATDFVRSKSEDGLSVTYGTMGAGDVSTMIGHPEKLKKGAVRIFQNLPNSENILMSVTI